MKSSFVKAVILVSLLSLTSISLAACGRSPDSHARIVNAGEQEGATRDTKVQVRLPAICGEKVPHAQLKVGAEIVVHDKLEGGQLDVADKRIVGCNAIGNALLAAAQVVK